MTIAFRLWAGAITTLTAIAALSAILVYGIALNQSTAETGVHLREVLAVTNDILANLTDAETGQRGFLLTGRDMYLEPYKLAGQRIDPDFNRLNQLLKGNEILERLVEDLHKLSNDKLAELKTTIDLRRNQGLDAALKVVDSDQGKHLMDGIRQKVADLVSREETELALTRMTLAARQSTLRLIGEAGGVLAVCLVLFFAWNTQVGVRGSLAQLEEGVRRISQGDFEQDVRLDNATEFATLAAAFNGMTSLLGSERRTRREAELQLKEANLALRLRNEGQVRHTRIVESISRMTRRMQGCRTELELAEVVRCFLPQMMPGIPGMVLVMSNSQNTLREITHWGEPAGTFHDFPPTDCWAFRRGQAHWRSAAQPEVSCAHVTTAYAGGYACVPLMALGDIIGLLYLEDGAAGASAPPVDFEETIRQIETGIENIALALVNLRLRETLRNQSIRDPLTGLFNRRYLQETFELDLARAHRSGQSIACIMIDADHFKHFNDSFGHDAGDAVLREISRLFTGHMRTGDIACRYGGEEFTLVLPELSLADALVRADAIRLAAKGLTVSHRGQALGPVTLSLGVACYPEHGDTADAVLAAADSALLRAKSEGRDRVVSAI